MKILKWSFHSQALPEEKQCSIRKLTNFTLVSPLRDQMFILSDYARFLQNGSLVRSCKMNCYLAKFLPVHFGPALVFTGTLFFLRNCPIYNCMCFMEIIWNKTTSAISVYFAEHLIFIQLFRWAPPVESFSKLLDYLFPLSWAISTITLFQSKVLKLFYSFKETFYVF